MPNLPEDREPLAGDGILEASEPFSVSNEFTSMRVRKVRLKNGERLELVNPRTGVHALLDPMQLEIIALQQPDTFTRLLERTFAEPKDG
jgi:hypothetical protein